MQKTLFIVIGAVFSIMFLGIVMKVVFDKTGNAEDIGKFVNIQASEQGNALRLAWETDLPTNGALHYTLNNVEYKKIDDKFEKIHTLTVSGLSGTVEYYLEACDISGQCFKSDNMSAAFP
ncbi:hypothetical protein KY348_01750 [Candidatus Woesearchaeota archaeon]|nr:hypothetical protein [Candidatus Woesearchaeota archaeon]